MIAWALRGFGGAVPGMSPRLLPETTAVYAANCALFDGEIRPLNEAGHVTDVALTGQLVRSVYKWRTGADERWLRFPSHVDIARSPLAEDARRRIYWTGDTRFDGPRYSYTPAAYEGGGSQYPSTSFRLGVPAPESAPTVTPQELRSGDITEATATNPIVITSAGHGLSDDDRIQIESGLGGLNGNDYQVTVVDDDTFELSNTIGTEYEDDLPASSGSWVEYIPQSERDERFYVYTYVTELGEEGPPSPLSDAVTMGYGQRATVSSLTVDSTAGEQRRLDTIRIYRTATGSQNAPFLFVAEVDKATSEFVDTVPTSRLAERIKSTEWDPPPADLHGLVNMPNGIIAGAMGQGVWFCEPYQAHAWPGAYQLNIQAEVVALAPMDGSVLALTDGRPVLITGIHPANMSQRLIDIQQGCASARGVVSFGHSVIYPTPDGLAKVSPGGGSGTITRGVIKSHQWEKLAPATMHAYEWRGLYVCFYDGEDGKGGFLLDPNRPEAGLVWLDDHYVSGHRDHLSPDLYLLDDNGGVWSWDDSDTPMTARWRSGEMPPPRPANMAAARVTCRTYQDTTLRVFADGDLIAERAVEDSDVMRLPVGSLARDHVQVEVEGTDIVQDINIGESGRAV